MSLHRGPHHSPKNPATKNHQSEEPKIQDHVQFQADHMPILPNPKAKEEQKKSVEPNLNCWKSAGHTEIFCTAN
jgi:hypothetical protein